MAETNKLPPQYVTEDHASDDHNGDVVDGKVQTEEIFEIDDSQKLGVTSAVFLILNKMIGTGSKCTSPASPPRCAGLVGRVVRKRQAGSLSGQAARACVVAPTVLLQSCSVCRRKRETAARELDNTCAFGACACVVLYTTTQPLTHYPQSSQPPPAFSQSPAQSA